MVNLEELGRLLEEEAKEAGIRRIPSDTYVNIATTIRSLRSISRNDDEDIASRLRRASVALISKMASRLLKIRVEKMLKIKKDELEAANFTPEEKYIWESISEAVQRTESIVRAVEEGRPALLETIAPLTLLRRRLVTFLKPITAFVGTDLRSYGPFRAEDTALIPAQNAELLAKQGAAKLVQILE